MAEFSLLGAVLFFGCLNLLCCITVVIRVERL